MSKSNQASVFLIFMVSVSCLQKSLKECSLPEFGSPTSLWPLLSSPLQHSNLAHLALLRKCHSKNRDDCDGVNTWSSAISFWFATEIEWARRLSLMLAMIVVAAQICALVCCVCGFLRTLLTGRITNVRFSVKSWIINLERIHLLLKYMQNFLFLVNANR